MQKKTGLENELNELYAKEHEFGEKVEKTEVQTVFEQVDQIDQKLVELIKTYNSHFNPYWGEVMRAGYEKSYLAEQVDRYACIYMSRISDLNQYSPRTDFRPDRTPMAHEV
jgi:hypothetical protein